MKNANQWIINILKGIVIGIGGIAPGVSGGAFAVMLGVYDKLTEAIATFYKDFWAKMTFLSSIGIGVGIGIVGFSNVMTFLFAHFETLVKFAFIGLMVGTLPSVFGEANKSGFKKRFLVPFTLSFALTVIFAYLDSKGVDRISVSVLSTSGAVFYGGVIALGTIVPGISSSIILMYAGVYEAVLTGISNLDFAMLIPMGFGFGLTVLLLAKIISYMFKKFYGYTYYMVLGFVVGSIVALMPDVNENGDLLAGISVAFIGAGLSYGLGYVAKKRNLAVLEE